MNADAEFLLDETALENGPLWTSHRGPGPLIGLAVHSGHQIRAELRRRFAIDEATRLREEDPYADYWADACGTYLLPRRSRFEVDLNRPRAEAIYRGPEDAWGVVPQKLDSENGEPAAGRSVSGSRQNCALHAGSFAETGDPRPPVSERCRPVEGWSSSGQAK